MYYEFQVEREREIVRERVITKLQIKFVNGEREIIYNIFIVATNNSADPSHAANQQHIRAAQRKLIVSRRKEHKNENMDI